MTDKGKTLIFMGRELGLCDGWDGDQEALTFYGYWPHPDLAPQNIPNGDLTIDMSEGTFDIRAEGDENPLMTGDILTVLNAASKVNK
jgi:hypothetical protein